MARPKVAEIGAGLVAIVGVIGVGRVAYGVAVNLSQDDWSGGARAVFLVLNSIVLLFSAFILAIGYQVRQGRMWAWIVSLVMMPFSILFGAFMVLISVAAKDVPLAGSGIVLAAAGALLTLGLPRTSRAYFTRKMTPAPHPGWAPIPGQPWAPMPGQPVQPSGPPNPPA
jgi:hypothetical protein